MQHLFSFHSIVPSNGFVNKRYELTTGPLARHEWKLHMLDETKYPNKCSSFYVIRAHTHTTRRKRKKKRKWCVSIIFPSMLCTKWWWVSVCAHVLVCVYVRMLACLLVCLLMYPQNINTYPFVYGCK